MKTGLELSMTSEKRAANGFKKQEEQRRRAVKSIDLPGRAFFGACGCFGATEYNRLGKVAGADRGAGACLVVVGNRQCRFYFTPVRRDNIKKRGTCV